MEGPWGERLAALRRFALAPVFHGAAGAADGKKGAELLPLL